MNCEKPYVLLALLLVIPVVLIMFIKNKKNNVTIEKSFAIDGKNSKKDRLFKYGKMLKIKSALFISAWCMLILAYSKISWGTYLIPVQKSGTAVSFVFDISNSMMANDGPKNITRLKAASLYAKKLIEKMDGVPISVVLVKGEGVTTIPITEDYPMIESLLEVLSPSLMTAPGSSIGKGILKAKESFPVNYSNAGRIWVFTDGEETDNHLKNSVNECLKNGIPVTFIGFGKTDEVSVLAGDGETYVKTALQSQKIQEMIDSIEKSRGLEKKQVKVSYVNSAEKGSALRLLSQISRNDKQIVAYEEKPVPRFKLFLIIAVFLFAAGFVITEFDLSKIIPDIQHVSMIVIVLFSFSIFTGCSSNTMKIVKGSYAFNQKQYSHAVSCYLDVEMDAEDKNDESTKSFSLFDLGTAYSKLAEDDAAMEKYMKISEKAPESVKFAAFYNAGVISYKNAHFAEAVNYFRKALEIDNTNIEAKVNLELSIQQAEVEVRQADVEMIPTTEDNNSSMPDMENAIYETIKENDKKQWKSSESSPDVNLAEDY